MDEDNFVTKEGCHAVSEEVKKANHAEIVDLTKTLNTNFTELGKRIGSVEDAIKKRNHQDAVTEGKLLGRKETLEEINSQKDNIKRNTTFWLSTIAGILFILQILGLTFTYNKAKVTENNNIKLEEVLKKIQETIDENK